MTLSSRGMDTTAAADEVGAGEARALARALGIAWVGATLYADPLEQDAFGKAAERIAGMAAELPVITVAPRTLRLGDRDLGEEGLSIEKLAHSCFIHGISLLRFTAELTPRSLATFMEVIQLDPEVVARDGGLARLLRLRLVLGIEAFAHVDAMEHADELSGWDERWGWSAESLTAVLESTGPDQLGSVLMEGFHGAAALASVRERQAAVTSHVEALMNLRPELQAELLDWLGEQDESAVTAIFDHLATHELLRLSDHLSEPTSGHALRLLEERGVEDPAWRPLDPGTVAAGWSAELPVFPPVSQWLSELEVVMAFLLDSDHDPGDRETLIESWASLFDSMLAQGHFIEASSWLEVPAGIGDPDLDRQVEARRGRMPSPDGLRLLVEGTVQSAPGALELLLSRLREAPDHVLDILGNIPDVVLLPALDALAGLPGEWELELLDHLPSSPRPLTIALGLLVGRGFVGRDSRLVDLIDHVDPAVRTASLQLSGPEISIERLSELLGDESPQVQLLAAHALVERGTDAISQLADAVHLLELPDTLVTTIATALQELPGGTKALERAAQDVQLLVSGSGRARRKLLLGIAKEKP